MFKSNFKSFLKGFISIFNIDGEHLFVEYAKKSPVQIDYEAILSDWETVGNDLREAFTTIIGSQVDNRTIEKEQLEQLLKFKSPSNKP